MNRARPLLKGCALVLAASTVSVACAATSAGASQKPSAPVTTIAAVATANATAGGGKAAVATLPSTWPATVPVPPGVILGSTSRPPNWSVLILVRAGAATVQKSAIAFYVAHGYVADSGAIVHNAKYRLTMIAENRDHSATKTNLTIALTLR